MMHHACRFLAALLCLTHALGFGLIDVHPTFVHDSMTLASSVVAGNSPADLATGLLSNYRQSLMVHPLETKMITGAVLAVSGDAIAQSRDDEKYDKKRASSFMVFDMAYRAVQHKMFPIIVQQCHGQYLVALISLVPALAQFVTPQVTDFSAAMEQTLASQLGIVPFFYYPVFFSLTGAIQGLSVEEAVDRAKENFVPLMKRNLLFWIPVQFVQFGFVEESLQIPFLSMCGLCWTFILSVMAGSAKEYKESPDHPYCVTGLEEECELPEDLFPHTSLEEVAEEVNHAIFGDVVEEVTKEVAEKAKVEKEELVLK